MEKDSFFSNPFGSLCGLMPEAERCASAAADSLLFAKALEDLAATPPEVLLAQKEERMPKKKARREKTAQTSFGNGIAIDLNSAKRRNSTKQAVQSTPPPAPSAQKTLPDEKKGRKKNAPSDDLSAFLYAMEGIVPLKGKERVFKERVTAPVVVPEEPIAELLERTFEFQLVSRDEYVEGSIAGLDVGTLEKLKNGGFSPEAHLDLHGFTVSGACEALRTFMRDAWYKGLRTVLLIPGRGLNSLGGFAILRAKLTQWLTQEPFRRVVLAFCTALPADGGPGSIYVLLRRYKKKGHVYWERTPLDSELF